MLQTGLELGQDSAASRNSRGIGRTLSAASAGESLQRLLTGGGEDESFAAAMETVPPWVSNMGVPQPPWMYPPGPQAPASAMMPPRWSIDNLTVQTAVQTAAAQSAAQAAAARLSAAQVQVALELSKAKAEAAHAKTLAQASAEALAKAQASQPCGSCGMPCGYPSLASASTAASPFRQELHRAGQEAGPPTHFSANQLCIGPPVGRRHSFHQETKGMGIVQPDFRQFTKVGYEGRLSVVSESQVHQDGLQRYLVQFTSGELSRADGVGFVFSQRLPCAKNIQRIVSIFVNQRGRICMRAFAELERASAFVKPLELGDCVEMAIDLTNQVCCFNIWECTDSGWPDLTGKPASSAELNFGARMSSLSQAGRRATAAPLALCEVLVNHADGARAAAGLARISRVPATRRRIVMSPMQMHGV